MRINAKILFIIGIATYFSISAFSQSEKSIKKRNISKRIVIEYNYEDGLDKGIIEEEKHFDTEGNIIEHKTFNNSGKLKEWLQYTYNENGDLSSEIFLDDKEHITSKIVYEYDQGLKKTKLYYDGKNRLVKKKSYEYSYR